MAHQSGEREADGSLRHRRVVVKVGTNLLTGGTDHLDREEMATLANQIAQVRRDGCEIILVTSGSIAAGAARLGEVESVLAVGPGRARHLDARQVLAAVGQSRLMTMWDELFTTHGVAVAQALLTRRDLADRRGYLNARSTLLSLLALQVLPIVNENDVVSVEEIEDSIIGDNDNLSAQVCSLVDADLLLILTDIAGLYTADPAHDASARLIERVERIDVEIQRAAAGLPGRRGTGGMVTKVQAARTATKAGAHVVIADGRAKDVLARAVGDQPVGTIFLPTGDRIESRRRYLLSGLQGTGRITVDEGATRALAELGRSLLPAGVVAVEGSFERGDIVRVVATGGRHIATGAVNYSSRDIVRIRGLHSDRIEETLGHDHGEEIMHRNNLVVL